MEKKLIYFKFKVEGVRKTNSTKYKKYNCTITETIKPIATRAGMLLNGNKFNVHTKDTLDTGLVYKGTLRYLPSDNPLSIPEFFLLTQEEDGGNIDSFSILQSIDGIGEKYASYIIEALGVNAINIIDKDINALDRVFKIPKKNIAKIKDSYRKSRISPEDMKVLVKLGFSTNEILRLLEAHKSAETIINILKEEPYQLYLVDGVPFRIVDRIYLSNKKHTPYDDKRIVAIIKEAMKKSSDGSTYYPMEVVFESFTKEFKGVDRNKLRKIFIKAFKNDKENYWVKEIDNTPYCGLISLAEKEKEIAAEAMTMINKYRKNPSQYNQYNKEINERELRSGFTLASSQKDAVRTVLNNGFTILTGGPGTGKTFTITSIIEVIEAVHPKDNILLLAPTGRASRRMSEQTGRDARTVHSALKLKPGIDTSDVVIAADWVIVDESSMLDTDVTYSLFKALSPHTKLVLVGDIDQLASVGDGAILRDFIASGLVPYVRLSVVYRQGEDSTITQNANKILENNPKLLYAEDYQLKKVNNDAEAQRIILNELKASVDKYGILESTVLTPTRVNKKGSTSGATSVEAINPLAQEILNPASPHKDEIVLKDKVLRVNDKVIQTVNTDKASNGDVGIITKIDVKNNTVYVDFSLPELVVYSGRDVYELDLAYAITIHKSQGSEYKSVIMAIMDSHSVMLQRNLIYTGITRAKDVVITVGQERAIEKAVMTNKSDDRKTLLSLHLENIRNMNI